MNRAVDEATKDVMQILPTSQLRPEAMSSIRTAVYTAIFRHTAAFKEELQKEINDLSRKLYIAEKKAEDEAVDSAGFNK